MPRSSGGLVVDYRDFYRRLFAPLEEANGRIRGETLVPVIGFDAGGPLSFCIFEKAIENATTYVSCELAVRSEQKPSEFGRYELLATSDDEEWVRSVLSDIGRESFDAKFGDGHTLDIGAWVSADAPIQAVVLEMASTALIDRVPYGILRCVGVTRSELEFARKKGVRSLLRTLGDAGIYPRTLTERASVV
jgi:hypothetical protein